MRAEFALFAAATLLSAVALLVAPRRSDKAWRMPIAFFLAVIAAVAPLLLYQFVDPALSTGRALWEWSAAGGPTIQASYRLDGVGTVGLAACTAYSDSHTDLPFLEAVGHPVAVNPDRELRRIAADRGWPVLEFSRRAYPHARRRIPPPFVAAGLAGAAALLASRTRGR